MQELVVEINGKVETVRASVVFHSRNPKTKRHNVNSYDTEGDKQKWVQLFCEDADEAKAVAEDIREGKLVDLKNYLAERRQ